ncbi:MAG: MATE family efflux transporter [Hyphomicrobiales bacterium]|nr:MATE family efflux transporter [Hyphomicrobiales bacterium]
MTQKPVFVEGSMIRHVLVMTASSSVGLVAIFVVDFLSLLYVSWLGDPALTAGVGYATQVLFFTMSANIGLSIAITALVARAVGAGRRDDARRIAGSGLLLTTVFAAALALFLFVYRDKALDLLGAQGEPHDVARRFLAITLPANPLMALGMALQGLIRACGDARRAMYVTLFGAIATAILDPLLIFGLHFGVIGAAMSTVVSRCVFVAVGAWGARAHAIVGKPDGAALAKDLSPLFAIAGPAILTNLATPVGTSYSMRILSSFGEQAVAAVAIIDRISPTAFGVLFALTGAIGPIIGQNLGAGQFSRVHRAVSDSFALTIGYVLTVWAMLYFAAPFIADLFNAQGETRALVIFFCKYAVVMWVFLGGLFVANAAFNNLGYPFLPTVFNWGRATIGMMIFVPLGAKYYGAEGGLMGVALGSAIFGLAAVIACFAVLRRIARRNAAAA